MTQENRSPRQELRQAIADVFRAGGPADPDFADELTDAVLDAIKGAGGVVAVAVDIDSLSEGTRVLSVGKITEHDGKPFVGYSYQPDEFQVYVNVLEHEK